MTSTDVVWKETVSRGLAVALMNNFTSVAEALKELIDNPIDYRWGQQLNINVTVDKKRDVLVVASDGGRGMDASGILVWLNWGEGEKHGDEDIARWHQGGKAACGFLGRHVRLWAKRAGSDEVWFLEDEDWATRSQLRDFGTSTALPPSEYPHEMRGLSKERGHVRIEVSNLSKARRWNLEDLKRALSDTYRRLLQRKEIQIKINGEDVSPVNIPESTASNAVEIKVELAGGRKATGRAWRTKREQTPGLKSGFRLLHNGRLIKQGEWFGYNYEGKGALNSLVGELDLVRFTPNPNKTDLVERGDTVWENLSEQVKAQVAPLITELRQGGDETRVTKQEKERANRVADQLEKVFASLKEEAENTHTPGKNGAVPESKVGPGGRKRRKSREERKPIENPRGPNKEERQPRTHPPEDAVGQLARILEKITGGSRRPPLRTRAWDDPTERSAWVPEGRQVWLDINKNYHLYKSFSGSDPYIAETAILQICSPQKDEELSASSYIDKVNLMLLRWVQVAEEAAAT